MDGTISIRRAKFAKIGLKDMIMYIQKKGGKHFSEYEIVEVGCYVGDSTEIFAENCKKIHCIDPWENGYDLHDPASYQHPMEIVERQFDRLLERFDNIVKYRIESGVAVNLFKDKSLDMVYIDGLHTYEGVKKDIQIWKTKIKPGGFLAGHDYQGRFPGTMKAINEFKHPDMTFRDTSWVIKVN